MKPSTKRKAISNKEVSQKRKDLMEAAQKELKRQKNLKKSIIDLDTEDIQFPKNWGKIKVDGKLVDFDDNDKGYKGLSVPTTTEDLDKYYQNCGAEDTVGQIKNAGKWLGLEEPSAVGDYNHDEYHPINYWKYACITILLGLVAGIILSTPLFVELADVCTQ